MSAKKTSKTTAKPAAKAKPAASKAPPSTRKPSAAKKKPTLEMTELPQSMRDALASAAAAAGRSAPRPSAPVLDAQPEPPKPAASASEIAKPTKKPQKKAPPAPKPEPIDEIAPSSREPAASHRSQVIAEAVREADELLASAQAEAEARKGASAAVDSFAPPPPPLPAPEISTEDIEARIRELEGRVDRMIEAHSQVALPALDDDDDDDVDDQAVTLRPPRAVPPAPPSRASVPQAPASRASVPAPPSSRMLAPDAEPTVFDTARELLSTNYYLRKWGRLGLRNRSEEVDDFGYDPVYETRVKPFIDFMYSTYFRVETSGVERVPADGRCLLVANHSGTVPLDGLMLRAAVKREHPQGRDVRWLAEDFIFHMPFLGSFTTRIGAVRACQENAERLLKQDSLVAVFPEGMKGTGKLFRDRYRLQRFGRGGFVRLALRTRTPIVPVAVLGGEETQPLLARLDSLGKPLGFPYFPVTPTFPLLGPAGLAPAPTKWRIAFGEVVRFGEGPDAADDELLVSRLAEQVRGTIQEMVDDLVQQRKSVFFG